LRAQNSPYFSDRFLITGLPQANPVIKCERGCLLRRKMTKLRNRYPEDNACVLCFLRAFRTREEPILGRPEDCLGCQFLEWKLQEILLVAPCYRSKPEITIVLMGRLTRVQTLLSKIVIRLTIPHLKWRQSFCLNNKYINEKGNCLSLTHQH